MPLGTLTQAWISAQAAKPLDWLLVGIWRLGVEWVALSEGHEFDEYLSGSTFGRSCAKEGR